MANQVSTLQSCPVGKGAKGLGDKLACLWGGRNCGFRVITTVQYGRLPRWCLTESWAPDHGYCYLLEYNNVTILAVIVEVMQQTFKDDASCFVYGR